jgi:hypothetical protein
MAEQVYFKGGGVRITSTRAIFDSKTYALAGITSVEGREIPPDHTLPVLPILLGVVLFVGGIFAAGADTMSRGVGISLIVLGLAVVGLGVLWASRIRPRYAVIICTAATERKALISPDKHYVDEIIDALNEAIIDRG